MQVNVPYMDPVGIVTESHDTRVEINVSCLFHKSVSGYAKKISSCDNILSSTLMKRVCKRTCRLHVFYSIPVSEKLEYLVYQASPVTIFDCHNFCLEQLLIQDFGKHVMLLGPMCRTYQWCEIIGQVPLKRRILMGLVLSWHCLKIYRGAYGQQYEKCNPRWSQQYESPVNAHKPTRRIIQLVSG